MKAKIISNLCGPGAPVSAAGDYYEPHGTLQHVAHIPVPGVICQLKLGAAGLQYVRAGVTTHVIPREELVALFEKLEPQYAERPNGNTRPREVDELGSPAAPAQKLAPGGSRESATNS
jgi:hypothetical protein